MPSKGKSTASSIARLAARGREIDPLVAKFREEIILHPHFQDGLDELAERIQYGDKQSITAIIGPTSVGKTAMIDEFSHEFSESMATVPEENRTRLLSMELAAPEAGPFKWKDDLYIPALEALNEPCADWKIDVNKIRERFNSGDCHPAFATQKLHVSDYRNLFYKAVDRADVIAALFDEADHLRRPTSDSGIFQNYDSLKSRSNACSAHFALFGTVLLTDIFKQNGQISKRIYPIWQAPYSIKEMSLFCSGLLSIEEKSPVKLSFSIVQKQNELFSDSLGYLGLAHEQFDRAIVRAIDRGQKHLSWTDMTRERLHTSQLEGILNDTIQFMNVMKELDESLKQKRRIFFGSAEAQNTSEAPPSAVVRAPFKAKLKRETVGP